MQKLDIKEVVSTLLTFDIFALNETFVYSDTLVYSRFSEYDVYVARAVKLSQHGRHSGGVLVFVRKTLFDLVRKIEIKYDHMIVLEIDKMLFGTTKSVFLVCLYVHPSDSKYWRQSQYGFGLEILEQCLMDLFERYEDFSMIVCGDLNARTGCENAVLDDDDDEWRDEWRPYDKTNVDNYVFTRNSDDRELSIFGRELINICNSFDCVIANGLCRFGFDDSLTFVSSTGGSTIDYFIISSDLCLQHRIRSLRVLPLIESPHSPVCISVNTLLDNHNTDTQKVKWINKRIWDTKLEQQYIHLLQTNETCEMLFQAHTLIDYDVNEALKLFNKTLLSCSDCMIKRVCIGNTNIRDPHWFDDECKTLKTQTRHSLSTFRRTKQADDRMRYVADRKSYKQLTKKKKSSFNRDKAMQLASFGKDSRSFWREIRHLSGRKKVGVCPEISDVQWMEHFQKLFSKDVSYVNNDNVVVEDTNINCDDLNKPLSEIEVFEALRRLKNGKACGSDEILSEMLKMSSDFSISFMTKLFNVLFNEGIYPQEWSEAIIMPIFKKGDKTKTDNYRGISLLSIMSKCYTSVLNKRLMKWIEFNCKLSESQAGFRKGYSTFDHIFTLSAIVEKCFSKKGGKLYACFIDLKQAFDSVQREPLFETLLKNGIHGKFLKAVAAIYESVFSCVKIEDRLTDLFECPVGLRQGCILSPLLFSIFINEIASAIDENGIHGIQMLPGLVELFILLFADDIVLLSDTARGLQHQINILNNVCRSLCLNINKEKTKIIVFRKGGFLNKNEKWNLDGCGLEVVNEYNYLGFVFTTKMSLEKGVGALAVKGRRACINSVRNISKLFDISKSCFFKIFDTQVQPVLLYSAEVWGLRRIDSVEKVHTLACKRFLKVHMKVPNKLVYGETGRFPLYVNSSVRCIKYWLKILKMDASRLPHQAYTMLVNLDNRGKSCWASLVKNTLFSMGFGYAWFNQGVGCERSFVSLFKQRLKDNYMQEWSSSIMEKDIFSTYRLFKTQFESEKYFDFIDLRCFRDGLIKLRVGVLPINGSVFKRTFSDTANYLCPACKCIEDEHHFIFSCPVYDDIRFKYLNGIKQPYIEILRFGSVAVIRNLAMYIFYAIRHRQNKLETDL